MTSEPIEPRQETIASYPVGDGLTAELVDMTRKLVGDRYVFILEARCEVPLPAGADDDPPTALLRKVFGDHVPFVHKYERNFVDEQELEELIRTMKAEFEANLLPYLKREDIGERIKAAQLRELKTNFWKHGLAPAEVACLV